LDDGAERENAFMLRNRTEYGIKVSAAHFSGKPFPWNSVDVERDEYLKGPRELMQKYLAPLQKCSADVDFEFLG
jgi:hypothetical protein